MNINCIVEHDSFICVDAYDFESCSTGFLGLNGRCKWNIDDSCTCLKAMQEAAKTQLSFLTSWLNVERIS
jgi:hypothetical protein